MKILLSVLAVLFVLGCVGEMDYQDAVEQADHYTDMVCNGYWPDYEKRSPDCSFAKAKGEE